MILKCAEDSANYRALFQSLTKSMFCNCIYNSYNVNVNFINDEFINEFMGIWNIKCLGVAFKYMLSVESGLNCLAIARIEQF